MYEYLYQPLTEEQVAGYFERIHMPYDKARKPSKAYLNEIVRAQLRTIPFDDADVWANGVTPSLEPDDLYNKIIAGKRGGYCFELNSLLCHFLRGVGFDCYIVIIHLYRPGFPFRAPAHCGVVSLVDGEKLFSDVGYGGPVPDGCVAMDGNVENNHYMRMNGIYTVVGHDSPNGFVPRFTFKDMPAHKVELEPLNFHVSQRPGSVFAGDLKMNIRLDNGFGEIGMGMFKYKNGDEVIERKIESEEDAKQLAAKYFGLNEGSLPTRALE